LRWSSSPKTVLSSYFPLSSPLASGTLAMIPTPAAAAAGSTCSSGLRRSTFRMICTLATFGRAIACSASSTVSTETPYAAIAFSSTELVQAVEDPVVGEHGSRRAVQLHEVEGVHAEVLAAAVGPAAHRLEGERLGHVRVGAPAELGRDGDAGALLEQLADQAARCAVAVDVGGVEERHAGVHSGVQDVEALGLADGPPVGRRAASSPGR
jgi:hypothetical protein